MKYRDYKIGFTFEVPDYFSEVRESSYEVFEVDDDVLHYFIQLDDDGEVVRHLSFGAQGPVENDEEFKETVDQNIALMEDVGYAILKRNTLRTDKGRTIERCVVFDPDVDANWGILVYYTVVKNKVISSSCLIKQYYDEFEEELYSIFDSIEEL